MKLKNFGMLFFAALLGSIVTVGAVSYFFPYQIKNVFTQSSDVPFVYTNFNATGDNSNPVLDFTSAAQKVMDAVVHIRSTQTSTSVDRNRNIPAPFREFFDFQPFYKEHDGYHKRFPKRGSGSGVIISTEGHIVTNNHVVDNADELEVTLYNNKSYSATVLGTDPSTDIALIKIDEEALPFLALTDSDNSKVGEWVLAVGNPFNLNSTVTAGIISAKGRNIGIIGDSTSIESFIQTDAAVNPGNSGGALVNLNGDLVGINTAIASPTGSFSGYSFAIPSNIVRKVVEDLRVYGSVQRGWLGVSIQQVSSQLVKEKDLEVDAGAYVAGFAENSGAKDAGIKEGDVITMVDEREVRNTSTVIAYVGSKRPGDKVRITINRDGKTKEFDVTLKNREGNTKIIKEEKDELLLSLGLDLESLDDDLLEELDIDGGVLVRSIKPGKIRQKTDMREGFIITKINDQKVFNPSDVSDILKNKKGGVLIEGIYKDGTGVYYYGIGL